MLPTDTEIQKLIILDQKDIQKIPFTRLYTTGNELEYISQAISDGRIAGSGNFTKQCQLFLQKFLNSEKVLLTHSCTAALEMAVILAEIQPGDEVIMPSYTFVSTANAVVLRGGVPVFVDIRPDTLNLDESKIEAAITPRTKAIMPVHYAGIGCEMNFIRSLAEKYNLLVIEDAAQGLASTYQGQPLGSLGHMAAFSFHVTKNIVSGEGGALVINDPALIERAEIIWEKGTNRNQFSRGEVDKYTWVDIGSSFLPSELTAAFLLAQLEQAQEITLRRKKVWGQYHKAFAGLGATLKAKGPSVPDQCQHNAHIYYLLLADPAIRSKVLNHLKQKGIQATFHYVPLHSSPAGRKYGRVSGDMYVTEDISERLFRLPLSATLTEAETDYIISAVLEVLLVD